MKHVFKLFLAICVTLFTCGVVVAQNVVITPLDANSNGDDFAPIPAQHGNILFFSSDRGGEQQLYVIERTANGWSEPQALQGDVNDGKQVGTIAVTPDGQQVIFAAFRHDVDGQGRTDLYIARKRNGKWREVKNLGPNVNSSFYDSQPTLSADGRTLYFVSDRTGGAGGTDIYMSMYDGTNWSSAKPLAPVNTTSNEMSPVIAADGKTFTFSSDRSGGTGGYDIYSTRIDGGTVSAIKNVGAPINTAADEMFYSTIPNSDQAFFSRSTLYGDFDNYQAVPNPVSSDPVTLVEGRVYDVNTSESLGSSITVTDLTTGKVVAKLNSDDETGRYFVTLTPGRQYSITAEREGYLFHSERYDVPATSKGQTLKNDIGLVPYSGGSSSLLVFFDYDKAELKPESTPELERVIELLRDHPKLTVRFEGHTDDQGSDDYNDKLSQRRADAVRQYLLTAGISADRVAAKGMGKRKPMVKESTDEARAKNRRVEMSVDSSK